MRYLNDIKCFFILIQTNDCAFVVKILTLTFYENIKSKVQNPCYQSILKTAYCTVYMSENLYIIKLKLADNTALLYCMFNDP
jgi:hypothetical protein